MKNFSCQMKSATSFSRASRCNLQLCSSSDSTSQRMANKDENQTTRYSFAKTGIEAVKTISDPPKKPYVQFCLTSSRISS